VLQVVHSINAVPGRTDVKLRIHLVSAMFHDQVIDFIAVLSMAIF